MCSKDESGGKLSLEDCQKACDNTKGCAAFNIESNTLSGETLGGCCLFLAGNVGMGDAHKKHGTPKQKHWCDHTNPSIHERL